MSCELAWEKKKIKTSNDLIDEATKRHLIIDMVYKGVRRKVHPYSYSNGYFVAYCTLRKALRTFIVDRAKIKKVGGRFDYDNNLYEEAEGKLWN